MLARQPVSFARWPHLSVDLQQKLADGISKAVFRRARPFLARACCNHVALAVATVTMLRLKHERDNTGET
jgi:hypothetical protein